MSSSEKLHLKYFVNDKYFIFYNELIVFALHAQSIGFYEYISINSSHLSINMTNQLVTFFLILNSDRIILILFINDTQIMLFESYKFKGLQFLINAILNNNTVFYL